MYTPEGLSWSVDEAVQCFINLEEKQSYLQVAFFIAMIQFITFSSAWNNGFLLYRQNPKYIQRSVSIKEFIVNFFALQQKISVYY
jgi:hypothetical protein